MERVYAYRMAGCGRGRGRSRRILAVSKDLLPEQVSSFQFPVFPYLFSNLLRYNDTWLLDYLTITWRYNHRILIDLPEISALGRSPINLFRVISCKYK